MRLALQLVALLAASAAAQRCPYVDQSIGTGGHAFGIGSTPMAAQVPFGAVRPGPDTCIFDDIAISWRHFGGYYYGDSHIRCFSHTHMVGAGVEDLGALGIMPVALPVTPTLVQEENYRSSFSHSAESNTCGHYKVNLQSYNIEAELTATMHTALHRYSFPSAKNAAVLFPVSHSMNSKSCGGSNITLYPQQQRLTGWSIMKAGLSSRLPGGLKTYFAAELLPVKGVPTATFSQASSGVWVDSNFQQGTLQASSMTSQNVGAFIGLNFLSEKNLVVEIAFAISYISEAQAQVNLDAELKAAGVTQSNSAFDAVLAASTATWEDNLGKIAVTGGTHDDQVKFYTAMYHAHIAPTTWSEVGGNYVGFDQAVHNIKDAYSDMQGFYTDLSIWDIHRSQMPLMMLLRPDVGRDTVRSLLLADIQGGDIPRWPLGNGYTGCMIGQHADVIIADAIVKGVVSTQNFDVQAALKAMVLGATTERPNAGLCCVEDWVNDGYIPFECPECGYKGASETLAFAYDASAIATVATYLKQTAIATRFTNMSMNYKKVWNPQYKFFCPRSQNGDWKCPDSWFDMFIGDAPYVEGDAWHWRWFVPHDINGLIGLFDSKQQFVDQLSEFFYRAQEIPENTLPNPYYWAGNEPDILAVWLFNQAGRVDFTQQYSRWLLEHEFLTSPDGLPGNDDYGTMSAWFVFASTGFYPLAGSETYFLGSSLFDQVEWKITNTTLIVHNNSPKNIYVQKYVVNGVQRGSPWTISHSELLNGVLEFYMSSKPSL